MVGQESGCCEENNPRQCSVYVPFHHCLAVLQPKQQQAGKTHHCQEFSSEGSSSSEYLYVVIFSYLQMLEPSCELGMGRDYLLSEI